MGDWALQQGRQLLTPINVTVNPSSTANTKGSWTQLISATPYDVMGFLLALGQPEFTSSPNPVGTLLDIGVGGAGSEVSILDNFMSRKHSVSGEGRHSSRPFGVYIPLAIPKGTRMAGRCQANAANATAGSSVTISLIGGGLPSTRLFTKCVTMGANTAATKGTVLTDGAGYVQIVSSAARSFKHLIAVFGCENAAAEIAINRFVGIGGAGAEVNILDMPDVGRAGHLTGYYSFPAWIPGGQRLTGKCTSSSHAGQAVDSLILHGFS